MKRLITIGLLVGAGTVALAQPAPAAASATRRRG